LISVSANRFSGAVEPLVVNTRHGQVVYALDGSGSWGTGVEAAAWFREWIASNSKVFEPSPQSVTEALVTAIQSLPDDITDCEFHWSFSLAVAICGSDTVQIGSSGSLAAIALCPNELKHLFVPTRLIEELVSHGTISADEAQSHKYARIISSPFFGADNGAELQWSDPIPWCDDDRVVLGDAALPRFLEAHEFTFRTAIELRDAIEGFGGSSTSTVIVHPCPTSG
jgi:hypothetical protein